MLVKLASLEASCRPFRIPGSELPTSRGLPAASYSWFGTCLHRVDYRSASYSWSGLPALRGRTGRAVFPVRNACTARIATNSVFLAPTAAGGCALCQMAFLVPITAGNQSIARRNQIRDAHPIVPRETARLGNTAAQRDGILKLWRNGEDPQQISVIQHVLQSRCIQREIVNSPSSVALDLFQQNSIALPPD